MAAQNQMTQLAGKEIIARLMSWFVLCKLSIRCLLLQSVHRQLNPYSEVLNDGSLDSLTTLFLNSRVNKLNDLQQPHKKRMLECWLRGETSSRK